MGGLAVNDRIIRTFLAIAEEKSMAAAGSKLHFSQQVVSEHLKQLEEELGVQLVLRRRGSRQVALTRDGSDFMPLARSWAAFQDSFAERVEKFTRSRDRKVLRLAASSSAHQYIISHIVHKLMPVFPELELRLSVVEISDMLSAIASRAFDAAFMFETVPAHPSITVIPLFREERCVLCPANTRLSGRTVAVGELPPQYEVIYSNQTHNPAYDLWRVRNLPDEREPYLKVDSMMSIPNYLTDPCSWAIVPISVALQFISQSPEKLTLRHIVPTPEPRTFSLLIADNYPEKEVIQELLCCCDEYIAERPYLEKVLRNGKENVETAKIL